MSNEFRSRTGLARLTSGDRFRSGELISDDRVREILSRFAPILHRQIGDAGNFFSHSAGEQLSDAVSMTFDEVDNWQRYHKIMDKTIQSANELFVPIIDTDSSNLLRASKGNSGRQSLNKQIARRGQSEETFRVNLDEVIHVPIQPLEPRNLQFLIRPHVHFGGMSMEKGSLYNAFIGFDTYLKDEFDRWVVDAIHGTTPGVDGPSWGEGPVYSPFMPARSSVWFNTRIDKSKENRLEEMSPGMFDSMAGCEIHHLDRIGQMEIPHDNQLKLFFWQLNEFMDKPTSSSRSFPLLNSGR